MKMQNRYKISILTVAIEEIVKMYYIRTTL